MKRQFKSIVLFLEQYRQNMTPETRENISESLRYFYRTKGEGHQTRIVYTEDAEFLSHTPLYQITPEWMLERPVPLTGREIWIDGLFTSEVLDLLQDNIRINFKRLTTYKLYDPEVLYRIRDFRTLINLSYVVYLSKKMGISTKLDPVLSFPLGPNSISISEAAVAYQTIMTGQVYPIAPEVGLAMVPIITKIVDREGEILWEYKTEPVKILSDRISRLLTEILRKVMEAGTGQKARGAVRVFGVPIPSFGKTGTANRFTNSSFVGFIPGSDKKTGLLDICEGYVIASYVGYDDNRPMKGKHLAIYGASGALPLWIDTANAIVNTHDYKKNLEQADLAFNPLSSQLAMNGGFRAVPVFPSTGLPVTLPNVDTPTPLLEILTEVEDRGDTWEPKRLFEPVAREIE
jgi:hypothetical protein